MQQIAQFFKVSEEQFVRDWCTATHRSAMRPRRSIRTSSCRAARIQRALPAIFAPESFTLVPHETILFRPVSAL